MFVPVAIFVVFVLAVGVDSASVSLSSDKLTFSGYGLREEIWASLSDGKT